MAAGKLDIYVFAHWKPMPNPQLIGTLSALYAKGKKAFSFEYDKVWLKSKNQVFLDPDIQFFGGPQFPNNKENFGVFLDSMPDTWGRTLMKRRAAQEAKQIGEKAKTSGQKSGIRADVHRKAPARSIAGGDRYIDH